MTRVRTLITLVLGIAMQPIAANAVESAATQVFNRRIAPIFRSPDPSSCVQCHLSSVDLKDYILPSSDLTFVSLRDQGLIDLQSPNDSKILKLIRMGEKDVDENAILINREMREAEFAAFKEWIIACSKDARLRELPAAIKLARPAVSDEVIRHSRKSRVLDSFVRTVWSQRMRCFPCHTPHEVDPSNPKHKGAVKRQAEFAETYDQAMLERLSIFRESPEATLAYLIASSKDTSADRTPMLNLKEPKESLLVQKPMSKLPKRNPDGTFESPSYVAPYSHMGGLKLHANDHTYKAFVTWIADYARVVDGQYQSIDDLPADNWFPSKLALRIKPAPPSWEAGAVVQMFVHEWDEVNASWNEDPVAFTQGTVTPRHIVNGLLFLLGSNDAKRSAEWKENPSLQPGRYLVKTYYDKHGRIESDAATILTNEDFAGELEIAKARWREGFRYAEVVNGKKLRDLPKDLLGSAKD